jgi:protein-disulfide isomerase
MVSLEAARRSAMTSPLDPRLLSPESDGMSTRRWALGLMGAGALMVGLAPVAAIGQSNDDQPSDDRSDGGNVLNEAAVLRDPDIPVAGNADGDITIVEWFDYQCPYCRKLEPELQRVIKRDGKVRLVLKDWPILGPASVYASRLALAAKFQGKFVEAHAALIGLDLRLTEPGARDRLANAGIDVDRAVHDLDTNQEAIAAILKRNDGQATAFGFRGTPAFIVGKFRVPGVLTGEQFGQAIADARRAAKNK